jgi:ribosome-binding factor A
LFIPKNIDINETFKDTFLKNLNVIYNHIVRVRVKRDLKHSILFVMFMENPGKNPQLVSIGVFYEQKRIVSELLSLSIRIIFF